MEQPRGEGRSDDEVTRRDLLSMGAGAAGAALGLSTFTGRVAAWNRFDVDFRSCREVWMVVGDDLEYDPPAVANVVVATGPAVECHTVEFTPEAATTVPREYGTAPVVEFSVPRWKRIMAVLPYSRARSGEGRFDRPWCILRNGHCEDFHRVADLDDAACVRTAIGGPWGGDLVECEVGPPDRTGGGGAKRVETLSADEGAWGDRFGHAVAIADEGEVLLVGAPEADENGVDSGVAYVFRRGDSGWVQNATLTPDDGGSRQRFGAAADVSTHGDVAIVGARRRRRSAPEGGAYVFEFDGSTWTQTAKLDATDPADESLLEVEGGRLRTFVLGAAVALDGAAETAVVGDPFMSPPGANDGGALVFERDGNDWTLVGVPRNREVGSQHFGTAVDIANGGEPAVVSAPVPGGISTSDPGGYARVVPRDGGSWTPTVRLEAGGGDPTDELGASVACNAACDRVIAGDPADAADRGSVVVFELIDGEWSEVAALSADDGRAGDEFGNAVAFDDSGTTAIAGAPGADHRDEANTGVAYLFREIDGDLVETDELLVEDAGRDAEFGAATAIAGSGNTALVGAPDAEVDGVDTGAVYVFSPF